jgi:hypothetical protein
LLLEWSFHIWGSQYGVMGGISEGATGPLLILGVRWLIYEHLFSILGTRPSLIARGRVNSGSGPHRLCELLDLLAQFIEFTVKLGNGHNRLSAPEILRNMA